MNKLPNLPIQIVGRDNVSNLYDLLGSRPLVLALHRFFGCTLSQYELGNLIREYRSLENPGFDLVVGVQSYPAYIRSLQDRFDGVPVICDVEGELYKLWAWAAPPTGKNWGAIPLSLKRLPKPRKPVWCMERTRAIPCSTPGCLSSPRTERSAMPSVRMPLPVCPRWQTQPEKPACADCLTHNKKRERNHLVSLPFFAIHWIGA